MKRIAHSSSLPILQATTLPSLPTRILLEGSKSMLKSGDLARLPMAVALADEVGCAVAEEATTVAREAKGEETIPRMAAVVALYLEVEEEV